MHSNKLGCFTTTGILAVLITFFVTVGFAFASGGQMFSAGALNAQPGDSHGGVNSHAQIVECSACHAPPFGSETMADRCASCHTDIAAQMKDVAKLHGLLTQKNSVLACRDCHPEHRGASAPLTEMGENTFPHETFGFSLKGHQLTNSGAAFSCKDCHSEEITTFAQATCENCHLQVDFAFGQAHILAYGKDCLACHDGVDVLGKGFNHSVYAFQLTGRHIPAACEKCHIAARSIADMRSAPQDCFSCHQQDDEHNGQFGQDCAVCHSPEGWDKVKFEHNRSAFKLEGEHARVACDKCHTNNIFNGTPADCYSCHQKDDQHNGKFGTDCATCHTPANWKDAVFDHNKSAFKLEGEHSKTTCVQCHVDNVFKGTPADCYSCHQKDDKHNGQLGTNCAACHNPGGWSDVKFDHNLSTFKLEGGHSKAACEQCHVNKVFKGTPRDCFTCHQKDDKHKGQFGVNCSSCHTPKSWQDATFDHNLSAFKLEGGHIQTACEWCHINSVFKGTPRDCVSCHLKDDKHNGQFGTNCSSCHNPDRWDDAKFDHNLSAFKLNGRHVQVACVKCHVNNMFKGTPRDCNSCHQKDDEHNGQFGTDCASCHTTEGWGGAAFDHSRANFPLKGAHAQTGCQDCHRNGVFKGTPSACEACHTDPAFHAGALGTNCAACHNTSNWDQAGFNLSHPEPSAGEGGSGINHGGASCRQCHPSSVFQNTCTACHEGGFEGGGDGGGEDEHD